MGTCPFCHEQHKQCGRHVYRCDRRPTDLSNEQLKFEYLKLNFPIISCEENLRREYIDQAKSLPDIRAVHGIDFKSILFLLDFFRIPRRSMTDSFFRCTKNKIERTNLERYGAKNVLSKGTEVYARRNETVKARYGVDNVFQTEQVISKIIDDDQYLRKYGMTRIEYLKVSRKELWNRLSDAKKNELIKARATGISFNTSIERKVAEALDDMLIAYERQFTLNSKVFDFRVSRTNLLIEVNGDFWHANPASYGPEDDVAVPGSKKKAKEIWAKDDRKMKMAVKHGYDTIVIWEQELKGKTLNEIKDLILNKMRESVTRNDRHLST